MPYNTLIPRPTDLLSTSQSDIQNNFLQANTSFGIDHYTFDSLPANNGKHNLVTTPLIVGSAHPATSVNEPKMYAMQDSAPLGVLNYSRGGNNAPPTPLTSLHSPTAPITLANNSVTNVLDASGLTLVFALLTAISTSTTGTSLAYILIWNGTSWRQIDLGSSSGLSLATSVNTIQIKNTSGGSLNDIFWTLDLFRINK